jgi:hypothetical protein
MNHTEFPTELHPRLRPTHRVQIEIPVEAWHTLEQIAVSRDMSVDALLKRYIGEGLRHDAAQRFAERMLDRTADVLARYGQSPEQIAAIVDEIRRASDA